MGNIHEMRPSNKVIPYERFADARNKRILANLLSDIRSAPPSPRDMNVQNIEVVTAQQ